METIIIYTFAHLNESHPAQHFFMTKKSNVYTRTGDSGSTSLVGGTRARKNDPRVEAYGTIDELNSFIALLIASGNLDADSDNADFLRWVQNRLFDMGAYLATDNNGKKNEATAFGADSITRIETEIDRLDSELPPLRNFILPGGTTLSALSSICRTVCRRAERDILTLNDNNWVDPNVIKFINRLSDYFYVLSRHFNVKAGKEEIAWKQINNK